MGERLAKQDIVISSPAMSWFDETFYIIIVFFFHTGNNPTVSNVKCRVTLNDQAKNGQFIIDWLHLQYTLKTTAATTLPSTAATNYSRTSLSRTRLFRITAYLEVKIWSLF